MTRMRIGELSRRVGVGTHTLRAWERRYGLLRPDRTTSGYRLYGPADEERLRRVTAARARGVPVSEAVRQVLAAERGDRATLRDDPDDPHDPDDRGTRGHQLAIAALHRAADRFDEDAAQQTLDDVLTSCPLPDVVEHVILPFLRELGDRWANDSTTIAAEHFISQLLRRRLGTMALTWGTGSGPVAVLACPPGEQHDLPLLCAGLLLARLGWRVRFLGADTPVAELVNACRLSGAAVALVSSADRAVLQRSAAELREAAQLVRLCLAGRGADPLLAGQLGTATHASTVAATVTALTATYATMHTGPTSADPMGPG